MFLALHPNSWDMSRSLAQRMPRWAFRGQSDAKWGLITSLERAAKQFSCSPDTLSNREAWMLRQFQRRAHHYIDSPPALEQSLEWLALIQHHGGPTRLLDFSYSFYVAAFFAMERAEDDAAVWAIRLSALEQSIVDKTGTGSTEESVLEINKRHLDLADYSLEGKGTDKMILSLEPERMNERLSLQQGLFLFPRDIKSSFEENLAATFDTTPDVFKQNEVPYDKDNWMVVNSPRADVVKIVIPRGSHKWALTDLQRMNVTSASLFPGLDGFARSLYYYLRVMDRDDDFDKIFS